MLICQSSRFLKFHFVPANLFCVLKSNYAQPYLFLCYTPGVMLLEMLLLIITFVVFVTVILSFNTYILVKKYSSSFNQPFVLEINKTTCTLILTKLKINKKSTYGDAMKIFRLIENLPPMAVCFGNASDFREDHLVLLCGCQQLYTQRFCHLFAAIPSNSKHIFPSVV